MKEIIVDVSNEGEVKITTKGFKGKSCVSESQFLKEVLGKETFRSLTPAYWEKNRVSVKKYLPLCG